MHKATHVLIATAALATGFGVTDTQAGHKPADVADPTLARVTPPGTAPLYIHSHHLHVRDGAVRVAVECPPLARHCHGTLELRSLEDARMGAATVDLAGAEQRRVRIGVGPLKQTTSGRIVFRAGEPMATKVVVVHRH